MKNIIAFFSAVVIASSASAASLNWTISSVLNSSGEKAENYMAYLFITTQSSDFGAKTISVADCENLITSGGDLSDYIAASKLTNANGGVTGATGYNGTSFAGGDSLTAFAVIFDASDYASASNYIITKTADASWSSATGAKNLVFGSQANATWSPTSVPEPGTAALALLGVGMLLKRRKA